MTKEQTVELQCSFCGKSQREVRKLIAGPTVYICDECIKLCNDIIAKEAERRDPPDKAAPRPKTEGEANKSRQLLCCSFCGKSQREVRNLIAGPTVYICDECIGLCNDIISEEIDREERAPALKVELSDGVRRILAALLERGMPAAVRIRDLITHQIIVRRPVGEPPDELLSVPWDLATAWKDLRDLLAKRTPQEGESGEDSAPEEALPGWVSPIAERLAGTLEVLGVLAQGLEKPGLEELQQLRPSVEVAGEKLREACEMLLAAPAPTPAPQD